MQITKEASSKINNQVNVNNKRAAKLGRIGTIYLDDWKSLLESSNCRCAHCGSSISISIDHVIPLFSGGTNTLDNVQPLCKCCNSKKRIKTIDYRDDKTRQLALSLIDKRRRETEEEDKRKAKRKEIIERYASIMNMDTNRLEAIIPGIGILQFRNPTTAENLMLLAEELKGF